MHRRAGSESGEYNIIGAAVLLLLAARVPGGTGWRGSWRRPSPLNRIKPELDVIRQDERGITRASLMVARAPERPSLSRQWIVTKNNNSHKYVRVCVYVKFFLLLFCIFLLIFFFSTLDDNHPCVRKWRILLPPERFSLFPSPLVFHFHTEQNPSGLC